MKEKVNINYKSIFVIMSIILTRIQEQDQL